MITCITCTGDRSISFGLLQFWMANQTVKADQWIVVDDGKTQAKVNSDCEYVRRLPQKSDPKFTMLLNLEEAFKYIQGDKILFIEDDEYYASNYIEKIAKSLDEYEIVGIGRSKYYHLPALRWYKHRNMGHASLAQTGFTRNFFNEAKSCLRGDLFFDIRLWRKVNGFEADKLTLSPDKNNFISKDHRGFIFDDFDESIYCGMKGMPGRKGIGIGHNEKNCYFPDKDRKVLKSWIADANDREKYLQIKGEMS
jgi:glycosyltransferase involved in cell wall biosynthesis